MLLVLFSGSAVFGSFKKTQQFQLKVMKGNELIGFIHTAEVVQNNKAAYFLQSNVDVNVLVKVNIAESISDVFEANQLTHSVHTRHINGKLKAGNTLKKQTSGYELTTYNNHVTHLNGLITYSVLSLYYHEPAQGDQVYSQSFGIVVGVQKVGPGKYCLELPNGYTTTYTYDKGLLQTVETQTKWGVVLFVRV